MIAEDQQKTIKERLQRRGLTFKPLQQELIDHVCCDVEERMAQGISFDVALQRALHDIPPGQLKDIQTDTLDAINNRITFSRWLSYLSIVLMYGSVTLKVLHFPYAGTLLLLSFSGMAVSLLTAGVSGVILNKDKPGALGVLAVIVGIVALLIGYGFRILHFSGSDGIILLAVMLLIGAMFINTLYVYRKASGSGNILTFLHQKYTPGIERFLLFVLVPMGLYKCLTTISYSDRSVGALMLLIVIFGAGLQLIALGWRAIENEPVHRNPEILTGLFISSTCLTLVFLGQIISFEARVITILLYTVVSAWLAFKLRERQTVVSLVSALLVSILFLVWGAVKLQIVSPDFNRYVFNIPVLMLLVAALFVCEKNSTMRTYMIVSVGGYILEYPY